MTDLCENKNKIKFSNKTSTNRKLIEPATSKSQYLMIWTVNNYYLTSGHCTWGVIIERRS